MVEAAAAAASSGVVGREEAAAVGPIRVLWKADSAYIYEGMYEHMRIGTKRWHPPMRLASALHVV